MGLDPTIFLECEHFLENLLRGFRAIRKGGIFRSKDNGKPVSWLSLDKFEDRNGEMIHAT